MGIGLSGRANRQDMKKWTMRFNRIGTHCNVRHGTVAGVGRAAAEKAEGLTRMEEAEEDPICASCARVWVWERRAGGRRGPVQSSALVAVQKYTKHGQKMHARAATN